MKKTFLLLIITITGISLFAGNLRVLERASNGKGMLCLLQNRKQILFMSGSPEEMGAAHGELMKKQIKQMTDIIFLVSAGYLVSKDDWFFTKIQEVLKRTAPYTPKRFITECDAMSKKAGITEKDGLHINFFPEMFHCSGIAVRDKASLNGQIIHARVLDYMRDINLQKLATLMVFMPKKHNAWVSVSFAGFIGTVTAMNEKGLAMGEMGGRGFGKWDGLPMNFMMRRVMEECSTVEEALALMKSTPLTCDYYYIISDKNKNMVGVEAIGGKPIRIIKPGEQNPRLPFVPKDTVYISGGKRANYISDRLKKHYGKIDAKVMIDIIKRPVAMRSNLHNAIFLPESGSMYFADAGKNTVACNEPYYKINLKELIEYYKANIASPKPASAK